MSRDTNYLRMLLLEALAVSTAANGVRHAVRVDEERRTVRVCGFMDLDKMAAYLEARSRELRL